MWGPPYADIRNRAVLAEKLKGLGWTAGDEHKVQHSNWAESKKELIPHMAMFLTTIQGAASAFRGPLQSPAATAGPSEGAAAGSAQADEAHARLSIRSATLDKLAAMEGGPDADKAEAKPAGLSDLNTPIQALQNIANEDWNSMNEDQRDEAFSAMKHHQGLFKHTKYRNFKVDPDVAHELKMHRLVEDDIYTLLRDDRALQIMWDSVDLNRCDLSPPPEIGVP